MRHSFIFLPTLLGTGAGAATLYASHYSGTINTLSLDGNNLSLVTSVSTGNRLPSWITYDSVGKALYVPDEVFYGVSAGNLASFSIGVDGALSATGTRSTAMGVVASTLYGGQDGRSYIANAH